MALSDHLSEESVCMSIEAAERDDALRELLVNLVSHNKLPEAQVEPSMEALLAREKLGSTALGKGVAVPHARVEGLEQTLVAFGYSEEGIEFDALDGQPVQYFFLVISPEDDHEEYVALMGKISQLVRDHDFRRFLEAARESEDVVDLVSDMEKEG